MRRWLAGGALAMVGVATVGGVVVVTGSEGDAGTAPPPVASTAAVERGRLASFVSLDGTLTYRGRHDGSPYAVINRASGTYTALPEEGEAIDCGDELYRVDDEPVLLLCGSVPAFRDLAIGAEGPDVRQLNRTLHRGGYDRRAGVDVDPDDDAFGWTTQAALSRLQEETGVERSGELGADDAVFLPRAVRVADVDGEVGAGARKGGRVAQVTARTLEVQVRLDASQRGQVRTGARARIILPGNRTVSGRLERIGAVARADGEDEDIAAATFPAFVSLDEPRLARGLDRARAQVEITTDGVEDALSVPAVALVGRSGGGFAVELVRDDDRRELVAVDLGLVDTANGRVQIEGRLAAGDRVVVPSR